jgi:hypothetical protein
MRRLCVFALSVTGTLFAGSPEAFSGGRCFAPALGLAFGTINSLLATPGSINFQASNPNLGSVSGSAPASVSWTVQGGSNLQNWTLSVQADAGSFSGCSTVPVSAVTASCTGASVSGGGGTGSCSGSLPLSTVAQQVAAGAQGEGSQNYSVVINYVLAESWRYIATGSSCSLTLTYTVNAP